MHEPADLVTVLLHRARRVCAEAEQLVTRSELLVAAGRMTRDPSSMVKRCAWCGRLLLDRGWRPGGELPPFVDSILDEHTTHGICERCLRRLESDGMSKPLEQ